MRSPAGLRRQVVLWMITLTLLNQLMSFGGMILFYWVITRFNFLPHYSVWIPSPPEWEWLVVMACIGLGIATAAAVALSQRIIAPLVSVANGLRRVARGDLAVRATLHNHSLGEASSLVSNFNAMAERLEHMEKQRTFWNAAIAHELRTPITILQGRLKGLADGIFASNVIQFRSLLAQTQGLAQLIEDLRVVSLADSGHLELRQQSTDLCAEITSILEAFEPNLYNNGFDVVLNLGSPSVRCDPVRIRQALLALLENVRRHANPGKVRIQTRVIQKYCYLSIEDEGPGIPEEFVSDIFEAFHRGEKSGTNGNAGTGLGLAVVRAIAHAHDGIVVCRPSTMGGTLIELCWPS